MTATPLIVLDCETTGLQPNIHRPWEIAWTTALHVDDKLVIARQRSMFVRPTATVMAYADTTALDVGRYHDRYDEALSVRPADMRTVLLDDCNNISQGAGTPDRKPHLVGAVPSFDHNMLCVNWLGWPGFGEGPWHYHIIDVEALVAGKAGIKPPYRSSELTAAMGVTVNDATKHTAAGDVEWAMKLYAAVYELEII